MGVIAGLGLPSGNDRTMKIVSTLNSEIALRGSSELFYVDAASSHELPEAYNGLALKTSSSWQFKSITSISNGLR